MYSSIIRHYTRKNILNNETPKSQGLNTIKADFKLLSRFTCKSVGMARTGTMLHAIIQGPSFLSSGGLSIYFFL